MASSSHTAWNLASSPLASVTGTNYAPTATEIDQVKAALVEPQHELGRLESEITRVQAILDDLLSEKQRVEAYIDAHQALLSPIRKVPSELLAEIFMQCLPSSTSPYGLRSMDFAPLLMTTVSQLWRRIAIETPRLWSSLHVHFPPHLSEYVASQRVAGVKLWMERSGTLPVSISLHGSTMDYLNPLSEFVTGITQAQKNMLSLFRSVLHFSDRFQHMYLSLDRDDYTVFSSHLPSSFPILISLKLGDYRPYVSPGLNDDEISPSYGPILSCMPALKSLEIQAGEDIVNVQHALPCNWQSLTKLSISVFMESADVLGLLMVTPQLQSLEVGMMVPYGSNSLGEALMPVAILTDLISLRLNLLSSSPAFDALPQEVGSHLTSISTLFPHLVCPSLKSFHFCWHSGQPISQIPFLGWPLHALETLGLEVPLTPGALTDCLSYVPNIISFDFVDKGCSTDYHFITTLQNSHLASLSANNPSPLCPQLQHFRMIDSTGMLFSTGDTWSPKYLTDLLETRAQNKMLSSCNVFTQGMRFFSKAELHRLQRLKIDGLKLDLHRAKRGPPQVHEDLSMTGLVRPTLLPPVHPVRVPNSLFDMDSYETFDVEEIIPY